MLLPEATSGRKGEQPGAALPSATAFLRQPGLTEEAAASLLCVPALARGTSLEFREKLSKFEVSKGQTSARQHLALTSPLPDLRKLRGAAAACKAFSAGQTQPPRRLGKPAPSVSLPGVPQVLTAPLVTQPHVLVASVD